MGVQGIDTQTQLSRPLLLSCRIRLPCVGNVYTCAQAEPGPTRLLPHHIGLPQTDELGQCTPTGRYRPSTHQEDCCLPHGMHTPNEVVDHTSSYVEIAKLTATTSPDVILHLRSIFAIHGISQTIVSDDGPQYASYELARFASEEGFTHCTSSPRYPQNNGKAERTVQTVKAMLKKAVDPYGALSDTPQFRGGNPYFFRENPYQSVSFIYASMYSEHVHAIHTIPYQFTKSKEPKSEL